MLMLMMVMVMVVALAVFLEMDHIGKWEALDTHLVIVRLPAYPAV